MSSSAARADTSETFDPTATPGRLAPAITVALIFGGLSILAVLSWVAIVTRGTPNPSARGMSVSAMALSAGVLVLREGLEAVLVLAAVTAGLERYKKDYWPPILVGSGAAFLATIATWFVAVALISSVNASELAIQAATGLLAVAVLLVVMNWFFHKLYWTGWICHHCKRRKRIFEETDAPRSRVLLGLALLGFTIIYREGFEVVLFLQDLRLRAGSSVILGGAGIGLALTGVVATLTFVAHRRLPYKRMLVLTGILLAGVLFVMVGEQVQEMQLAGWLGTHPVNIPIPAWMGLWFSAFPNIEGLTSQFLTAAFLVGSFLWVRRKVPRTRSGAPVTAACGVED